MSAPYFMAFFGIFELTQSSDTRIQIIQLIIIMVYPLVPKYLKAYSYLHEYDSVHSFR